MAEIAKHKSSQRSRLAKVFLGGNGTTSGLLTHLRVLDMLSGLLLALLITWLLVGFGFQTIPLFEVGSNADRTIESPRDFTIEDRQATLEKKNELRARVPAVFDLDLRVNSRVEAELRGGFGDARRIIAEERRKAGLASGARLSRSVRRKILARLRQALPRFDQGAVLELCLKYGFSAELENQLVALLHEALKPPGVVLTRDILLSRQKRGILLRNTITGQDESISDWTTIRDLSQARDVVHRNSYQLTAVSGVEKKEMIGFLDGWVVPNVQFNESATADLEQMVTSQVDPVLIRIKKGRILVRKGDEVTARDRALLEQLRNLQRPRRLVGKFIGIFLVVGFFLFAVWQYLLVFQKRHRKIRNHYLLLSLVLLLSLSLAKLVLALGDLIARSLNVRLLQDPVNFHVLAPFALGAILLVLLVDVDISILYSLVFSLFVGLMTTSMDMFIYSLTGSLAAIYLVDQYRERAAVIKGGLVIGLVNVLTVLALQLYSSQPTFAWQTFSVRATSGLLSGLFAAMLASLLLPILEWLFEITTDIKLLELSNLNHPILRRLAVEAPGTYHHSIMVGTLAEAAAEAVGANPLLARVGAYYHDIGKLKTPEYYVENQVYSANKHENLTPNMSSLILVNHVKDGLALADEIKLVPKVRDMIPQHHGTRLMTYFFQKAKEAANGKEREVREEDFRYPGPKPQSREAAILMLADQVEAAARTLDDPTPGQIRGMIRRLVQSNIQDRQFDECEITMQDFDLIVRAFERTITGMHHHRVEYPGFDFNKRVEKEQTENQRIQ